MTGRVCVLTGATGLIGRAAAARLAAAGATVALAALAGEEAEQLAAELRREGAEASGHAVDLTDEGSVARLYADAASAHGRIDACVNNAGAVLAADRGPLLTSLDTWREAIELNLTGTFACIKHQLPHLIEAGGGAIVNVSAMAALLGSATPQIAYDAAKAGQLALTRDVAVAHAADGVRCNAVCPGPIEGPMLSGVLGDERTVAARLDRIPGGRFGRPEEVAAAIAFLANPAASWTNGAVLPVDGGASAAYNAKP
jgi:NAD(P)-dependent dehydrogenase (short-subunit alcohol dehydrogenase family)